MSRHEAAVALHLVDLGGREPYSPPPSQHNGQNRTSSWRTVKQCKLGEGVPSSQVELYNLAHICNTNHLIL